MPKPETSIALPDMSLPFGVEIRPAALVVPQTLTDDEVFKLGQSLRGIHTASAWWIADYILFVADMLEKSPSRRAGRAIYERVSKLWPAYSRGHLQNLASVARRVPAHLRRADLSFEHHEHVAKLADDAAGAKLQAHYLKVASDGELTAEELRLAISETKRGVASTVSPRKALPEPKHVEPVDGEVEIIPPRRGQGDGLPIAPPDEPEALADSHAQLAGDSQRTVQRLVDWYARQRKKGKPEDWTMERKKRLEHELAPLIDSMSSLADIYNELTNASESGRYAGEG